MADYGHDLQFGYFLVPDNSDPTAVLDLGGRLDALGYDLIGIQDHPYQRRYFDTMALIAMLLAQTERVRIFPDVANLPLRLPTMLAKEAATIDRLSGGRFELGLGAGAFWDAIAAMGGPVRSPGEAIDALQEAIEIIRAMWSGGRGLRHDGEIYRAVGAQPGPAPAHDMSIWLGVLGPRALRLTGRVADGWIPSMSYLSPDASLERQTIIDAAAHAAGRDPAAIRRIYNINGSFADSAAAPFSGNDREVIGPVEHWVSTLTTLATEYGFGSFILWTDPTPESLRLFINEVAPAVRERVAAVRSARG